MWNVAILVVVAVSGLSGCNASTLLDVRQMADGTVQKQMCHADANAFGSGDSIVSTHGYRVCAWESASAR